jgi:2-oxoglutarate ferredoxin oxidoreductase subunit alpha
MYERDTIIIIDWLKKKFKDSELFDGNKAALTAGFNYGNNIELLQNQFVILPSNIYLKKNNLIKISGNKAFSLGALASSIIFNLPVFSANYPITPASDILHDLSKNINENFKICQLEDEIAAINAVIGASYGGSLAFTCTSGPGLDLMQEGLGLAIMSQLPLLVLNIQRSGPSTGIPTRSEQTDLLASIFGRHGESGIIVLSPNSPSDCFFTIIEAFYISIMALNPVIILSDANLANSSELWETPSIEEIKEKTNIKTENIEKKYLTSVEQDKNNYWIIPGKKNLECCIGGLEKDEITGNVSYDPINHYKMTIKRQKKIHDISDIFKKTEIIGNIPGQNLLITWGSVYGITRSIYEELKNDKIELSLTYLRYLNPLPNDLKEIIISFKKIIVVEENLSQLAFIIRAKYLVNAISINQVSGKPFILNELKSKIIDICL